MPPSIQHHDESSGQSWEKWRRALGERSILLQEFRDLGDMAAVVLALVCFASFALYLFRSMYLLPKRQTKEVKEGMPLALHEISARKTTGLMDKVSTDSGVTEDEANAVDDVNLFDRLGANTFEELSRRFYDRVESEEHSPQWFRDIFPSCRGNGTASSAAARSAAEQNLSDFLCQRMGGPDWYYTERRGRPQLVPRHAQFDITEEAVERTAYFIFHGANASRSCTKSNKHPSKSLDGKRGKSDCCCRCPFGRVSDGEHKDGEKTD